MMYICIKRRYSEMVGQILRQTERHWERAVTFFMVLHVVWVLQMFNIEGVIFQFRLHWSFLCFRLILCNDRAFLYYKLCCLQLYYTVYSILFCVLLYLELSTILSFTLWGIVRLRLRKIIICHDFLTIGILPIKVFQHSTNVGYSIHW